MVTQLDIEAAAVRIGAYVRRTPVLQVAGAGLRPEAGTAAARRQLQAAGYVGRAEIVGVESALCPALHVALAAGRPQPAEVGGIAADSLGARQVGALMFAIAARYVARSVLVSDAAIQQAQLLLWERFRLIAEPGGATALAALTSGAWVPPKGAQVGVVICGGNTDPAIVAGLSDVSRETAGAG